jgi:2-desacetyl-2-hydroxyethyl bacteriochlorophyllide A dehydrogenase
MENLMKAVMAYGPKDYRFEYIPLPQPQAGEILMKVDLCGICASDIKAWQGGFRFWGGEGWLPYMEPPCIPGHEFFGRIVSLGKDQPNDNFKVGDRVIAEQIVPCGKCKYCIEGHYWMCEKHDVFGFKHYLNGGFAEYVIYPNNSLIHKIPESLSDEQAVLIEPYACAMHAVDRAEITHEDVVVLSGAGPLGLGMTAAIQLAKPRFLIVLDLKENRLEKAKALGANMAINPEKDDVTAIVKDLTDGYGCDVYIEATGYPPSVGQGLKLIRKMGRFVEFSIFNEPVTVDWSMIGDGKELDIKGSSLSPFCYDRVISGFADGTLHTDGVLTHIFDLKDFEEAMATCGTSDAIKVALRP